MKITNGFISVVSILVLSIIPAADVLGDNVISRADLDRTVAASAVESGASRETVLRVLDTQLVREKARDLGVDSDRLAQGVATLDGVDLERAAAAARDVETALAGGDTITIGVTTLIVILLLVIIILVAD
jgi:hypothetical protein